MRGASLSAMVKARTANPRIKEFDSLPTFIIKDNKMIITDEFLKSDVMQKYVEDSGKEIASSYVLVDFSKYITGFPMKTCLDIGSNLGIFAINASKYFENVYAFEPGNLTELSS